MDGRHLKPIAVLGAGSWGSALALHLARRGQTVRLWSVLKAEIDDLQRDKANQRFLPGFPFPAQIEPSADLAQVVHDVNDVLMVIPSAGFRDTLVALKPLMPAKARLICATKGLDEQTGQLLSEVIHEILGDQYPFAFLSGPSFAREVAAALPCAVMVASQDSSLLADVKNRFHTPSFHVETTDDVIGVQWGGVAKNVIAIATGVVDGMEWGANARSALITRGLAEMISLGKALGGRLETFIGLSGLGDLILTCSDNQSRNRRLGLALGKGQDIAAAEREIGQVVEGKRNAELVYKLAQQHKITMPICEAIWHIFEGKTTAKAAMQTLLEM